MSKELKEIKVLDEGVVELIENTKEVVVENKEEFLGAVQSLNFAKTTLKEIETETKKEVKTHKDAIKEIEAPFKGIKKSVDKLEKLIKEGAVKFSDADLESRKAKLLSMEMVEDANNLKSVIEENKGFYVTEKKKVELVVPENAYEDYICGIDGGDIDYLFGKLVMDIINTGDAKLVSKLLGIEPEEKEVITETIGFRTFKVENNE